MKPEKGTPEYEAFLARRRQYLRERRAKLSPEMLERERQSCRRWHEKNREYALNRMVSRRKENPGEAASASAKWREENPGRQAELNRAWKAANEDQLAYYVEQNRDRKRESNREWQKANPLAVLIKVNRRRARIAGAGGSFTKQDVSDLGDAQRWQCNACQVSLSLGFEIDHVLAVSRGGSNGKENLQLLCPTCNRKKGAKDWLKFLAEILPGPSVTGKAPA